MTTLRLEELNAANIVAANGMTLKRGQEAFLAANARLEEFVNTQSAWQRVVFDGDEPVAFVMANFDPEVDREEYRSSILRMYVAGDAQRRGVGSYTVEQVAEEAKRLGFEHLFAVWEEGDLGPGKFFQAVGFEIIGENEYGEAIGRKTL
ncbi:GNAT family N-acetyltransferase [Agrococcus sp. Marseille-Q4369]|uniref:GNAT family N-acetyltransferase n=1 Tax=Agrococcus sp. Marseille-Q4369 TaxID=2810513 RepID=UPI001B8B29A7|nr:GNAT family N-acetyltransferase [Agrococcus sp. Marseille-Q4369]QUW19932.1 GNAT family N-acetyltransferase [Agrococcus sp. Marseille-Q4369]